MHMETHEHDHGHAHGHSHDRYDHPHAAPPGPSEASVGHSGPWGRSLMLCFLIAVVGLVAYTVTFFVDQTEYVYVTEFGKPIRLCVDPGLEFKLPYQSVRRLDRRVQMSSPPGSQMLTRDRPRAARDGAGPYDQPASSLGGPPLTIDWFACWRVSTPGFASEKGKKFEESVLRFVQSVGTIAGAQDRLRERIDSTLKAKVGQMSLNQFVSLDPSDIKLETLNRELTEEMQRDAMEQFGIEVVEVRIKRFNHPEGVKPAIFDMIRAERQGVAEKYRADGKSRAAEIRSAADMQRSQILSKAQADAERIRGEGDAEAMRIANEAHSIDPKFYQLLRTLDTYRVILNEKTTIVLSSDAPLLKLLTDGMPQLPGPGEAVPPAMNPHKSSDSTGSTTGDTGSNP